MKSVLNREINGVDLQIIRVLEENARVSMRRLALKVGSNVAAVQKHVDYLEKNGVVLGYSPVIDPVKLFYCVTAIFMIQAESGHLDEVECEISKEGNVFSIYGVTGDFDAIVFARFKENASLKIFLRNLLTMRFVKRVVTMTVLNVVKESGNII